MSAVLHAAVTLPLYLSSCLCVSQGIRGIEGNIGGPGITGPRVRLNLMLKPPCVDLSIFHFGATVRSEFDLDQHFGP